MNNTKSIFAALSLLACLSPLSVDAQIVKKGNAGYLMRMKYFKGQTQSFLMDTSISGLGQAGGKPMSIPVPMSQTVKDLQGKIATIEFKVGPVKFGGNTQPVRTFTAKMDDRGNQIGKSSDQNFGAKLPEKPVRIGGTWTASVPFNGGGMSPGGTMTSLYKLNAIKNVQGKQVAEIKVLIKAPTTGTGPSGGGTLYLLTADGSLLKADMNMNMPMPGQATPGQARPTMKMVMTMRRK